MGGELKIIILCASLVMFGCKTAEQRELEAKAYADAVISRADRQCQELGLGKGTQQWSNCMMMAVNIEQQRLAEEQANRRHWANAIRNAGNTLYGPEATKAQQIPVAPYIYTPPKVTDCQLNGNGNSMRCIQQ